MKIKLEVELKPFTVPNYVIQVKEPRLIQDGFNSSEGIPLNQLSRETLIKLCEEFKNSVLNKGGYPVMQRKELIE